MVEVVCGLRAAPTMYRCLCSASSFNLLTALTRRPPGPDAPGIRGTSSPVTESVEAGLRMDDTSRPAGDTGAREVH